MIRVLLFLLVVFALGLGFAWLADRPGDMVVTFGGYQYQVSLMVAAVAVVAAVAAVMITWWLVKSIWNSPYAIARHFRVRRRDRGYQALSTGMIAAGADAILFYPLSPTALNRVVKQACDKGIAVFTYDVTVTQACAHNVSSITARYGANTAQWMVNQMGGKGEVVFNHGVAGTTVTNTYDEQAYGVFKKYPGIKIVGDFYGNWNDATSQEEVAKILAAHPNIDGIWSVDGSYGSLQAVINGRPDRLVTMAGQSNNGYRLAIADPAMQAKGLKGVSSSSGPSVGGYAFKLMMEVVTGKTKLEQQNVEFPLPWVEPQDVKVCPGEDFVDGCNTFPADKVSPLFLDTALDGKMLPELSIDAVQTGNPKAGATIQPLPPVKYADTLPGINCTDCTPPADWLEPNLVKPIPVPN